MIFEKNKPRYGSFPWWDMCAVRAKFGDYPVKVLNPADMEKIYANKRPDELVCGIPTYIARSMDDRQIVVWPVPDQDYEVVKL